MTSISLNRNTLTLILSCAIVILFFVAGLAKILDNYIVKFLLFTGFGSILLLVVSSAFKNEAKKNRPEDKLQDDSH